jgi:hypothetical protein
VLHPVSIASISFRHSHVLELVEQTTSQLLHVLIGHDFGPVLDFFFLFYLFLRCNGRGLGIQSFESGLGDVEETIWVFVPYPS